MTIRKRISISFLSLIVFYSLSIPCQKISAMIYKPQKIIDMWDTWVLYHQGKYYLYYLENNHSILHGVALAISEDGVHYKEVGTVVPKAPDAVWLGSGSVWRQPDSEKENFIMNFSESRQGVQCIYFAQSADLIHWERFGQEYKFQQDTRWYEEKGRWDCICSLPRPEGGLYGYWTATPKNHAGFGFGQS